MADSWLLAMLLVSTILNELRHSVSVKGPSKAHSSLLVGYIVCLLRLP